MVIRNCFPPASKILQLFQELIQRDALSICDVDNLSYSPGCLSCLQVSFHHVIDVGEIARLFAIAIDHRSFAAQKGANKTRNYARVLRAWILTRPKYVEISQRYRLQTIDASEDLAILLADELCHSIGREWLG